MGAELNLAKMVAKELVEVIPTKPISRGSLSDHKGIFQDTLNC